MKNNRTRYAKTFQLIQEQLLTAQILEFCESELFQETLQDSEVASSSNCCYQEQSSFTKNPSFPQDVTTFQLSRDIDDAANVFSLTFEDKIIENGVSTPPPLDITTTSHFTNNQQPLISTDQHQLFDLSLHQNQLPLTTNNNIIIDDNPIDHVILTSITPTSTTLPNLFEENNLSSMPLSSFLPSQHPSSPTYSFLDPSVNPYLPVLTEGCEIPNGNLFLGKDIQTDHELEFQGDNGEFFCNDPLPHSYNSNELQALSNESQHHVNGSGSCTSLLPTEITSMDQSESLRTASKLTGKERKEKIYKYMKKRNQRNFSKKIKYACRKTLADSRRRVRGRFVKNDEFGEINNRTIVNHEDGIVDEDGVVKEEEEILESLDIFTHISGVNSFKCNYPIQSWI